MFPPQSVHLFQLRKAFWCPKWLCELVSLCGDLEQLGANIFLQNPELKSPGILAELRNLLLFQAIIPPNLAHSYS